MECRFYNLFAVAFEVVMIVSDEKFRLCPVVKNFLLIFGFFFVFEVFVYFFLGIFVEGFRYILFRKVVVNNLYQLIVFDYCLSCCEQF